jgi:co-chaperonin GroES (HSP10)
MKWYKKLKKEMNKQDNIETSKFEDLVKVNEDISITDRAILDSLDIPFIPIDERILIKPLEPVMLTKEITEIDYEATQKARAELDEDQDLPEAITKTETKEVESNLRIGVVLAIGEGELKKTSQHTTPYEIGDKVVYVHKAAMPFELFKDSVLLRKYEILGKWVK